MESSRFGRITGRSLAGEAEEMIRSAIFEGRIRPEEKLAIERIAAELGISRTPVREAFKALEADGLLRVLPRRGAVVQRFDREELEDRYSIRAMVEGYVGELACGRQTPALADALAQNCERLADAIARADTDDLEQVRPLVELNREFHRLILEASGSETAARVLNSLSMPVAFILYYWRASDRRSASLEFHREIVSAFRAGRPKGVRRLLESHLFEARDFLMSTQQLKARNGVGGAF